MGRLSRRQRRELAANPKPLDNSSPKPPQVDAKPVGVSGTVIRGGRIFSESNTKLQWEKAYGRPSATEWGEWERLKRTDPQIVIGLNMLVAPLRNLKLRITAPGDYPEEIVSFLEDQFTEWLDPAWPTLLEQFVWQGLGDGFSLHERVYATRQDSRVPGGTAIFLKSLEQRLASSVESDGWIVRDGDLAEIRQSGILADKWVTRLSLPAEKTLLATWQRSGDNYQGVSVLRPIWYLANVRAELLKIVAIGYQRNALGVPVTKEFDYSPGLSDEQRDDLQTILENVSYHENAGFQLPKGVDIEWFYSPSVTQGHLLAAWRDLGVAILEVFQAQQVALGTNEEGNRAVGEVHERSQLGFVDGVARWIEDTVNGVGTRKYTGLVRPLVDWNFGQQSIYPKISLETDERELALPEFSAAVAQLSQAGALSLTADDENVIRRKLGLPEITPEGRDEAQARRAPTPLKELFE